MKKEMTSRVYKRDLQKRLESVEGQEEFEAQHPLIQKKIKKSLNTSISEGSYASVMSGFGTSYFTPFVLALKATASQVGILNAFINFIPSLIQIKSAHLLENHSRKKLTILSTFLQCLMFLPIILVGFLFLMGYKNSAWLAIFAIILFYAFGAIASPAWFSWMGSLVPKNERGDYFARRNKITGFIGLVSMLVGAWILDSSEKAGILIIGFGFLFFMSFIFRMISIAHFRKQYEPKLKQTKKDYFSLIDFLKRAPETPFGRFSIYTAFFRITVAIATPFWTVYILRDLGFSYMWLMLITIAGTLFQLLFYSMLGKLSDRCGNILLMKVSCVALTIGALLWVIIPILPFSPIILLIYLMLVPEMISGFGWAGFNLATSNYIYDSVRDSKRGLGIIYFNLLSGWGIFIGSFIGAGLALLELPFMNTMIFIFLVSSVGRLIVMWIGINKLREVRHVKHFTSQFIIKEFRPMQGFVREFHHLNHLGEKVKHYV